MSLFLLEVTCNLLLTNLKRSVSFIQKQQVNIWTEDILTRVICPKKNMGLSDNKCDKRIINESDKTHLVQGTQKSNKNIIYLKIREKTKDKKLSIVAR